MGEPIVCHELNPESRQHVEEGRFLVVASGPRRSVPMPVPAGLRMRLPPRKQLPADHLRIRHQ